MSTAPIEATDLSHLVPTQRHLVEVTPVFPADVPDFVWHFGTVWVVRDRQDFLTISDADAYVDEDWHAAFESVPDLRHCYVESSIEIDTGAGTLLLQMSRRDEGAK